MKTDPPWVARALAISAAGLADGAVAVQLEAEGFGMLSPLTVRWFLRRHGAPERVEPPPPEPPPRPAGPRSWDADLPDPPKEKAPPQDPGPFRRGVRVERYDAREKAWVGVYLVEAPPDGEGLVKVRKVNGSGLSQHIHRVRLRVPGH